MLVLELVLAHGLVGPQISKLVFLFVGVVAAAVALRFPMATALVILCLTDFIFYPAAFAKGVGPFSVRPHEIALLLLLILAWLRPKQRTWGGPAGIALLVFLAMVGVSDLFAIQRGATPLSEAVSWARPMFMLTIFYVVVRLFPSTEDRKTLMLGAAAIGAITGLVALAASTGGGISDALKKAAPETIRLSEGEGGLERVRLPGLSIGYGVFWYAVTQIVAKRGSPRLGWSLMTLGITVDILVSYNRNMWIGVTLGLLAMAAIGGTFIRSRLTGGVMAAVAAVAVIVIFGGPATETSVVQPVVERGSTLLNPGKTSKESSLTEREQETKVAYRTVKEKPLLGVGAGASFGMKTREPNPSSVTGYILVPQLFLHNQYLYLILISGIPGLIAFVFFLLSAIVAAVRRVPRDPAVSACAVGIGMIMLSAVVAIYFTVENMTAVLGLLAGVIIADQRDRGAKGETSGLLE